jgi:hypothetical protein
MWGFWLRTMMPAVICLPLACGGCAPATAGNGTAKPISFFSDPPGAECALTREGLQVGKVTTPGRVSLPQSSATVQVACTKAGYQDSSVTMKPKYTSSPLSGPGMGLANVAAVIAMSQGVGYDYESPVMIWLEPVGATAKASSPAAFDGQYSGLAKVVQGDGWQVDVRMVNGVGTGTAKQGGACSAPGQVNLAVDASGAVSGTFEYLNSKTCRPFKMAVSGRAEGNQLKLAIAMVPKVFSLEKVQ